MTESRTVVLTEHEPRDVDLSPQTAAWIQATHSKELKITRALSAERYRITPDSFVGSIVCPDVTLIIQPKCGSRNLFYLLTFAYRLARIRKDIVQFDEVEDIREFLLEIFAGQLEGLLQAGLRSEYLEVEDDEPVVRGRLLLDRLVRRAPGGFLRLPVRYEEFTRDVAANRIFRFTLESIAPAREPALQARLARCHRALGHVSRQSFTPQQVDAFAYTRLNGHYESPHQICRLLLEASGIEGRSGSRSMTTFLVDMNAVFERFVAGWLADQLPSRLAIDTQVTRYLDVSRKLTIRPDILISRMGTHLVVADTKYKLLTTPRPRSADAYQMLAYCRSLGLSDGALIYVDHRESLAAFTVVDGETTIHCWGLNLTDGVDEIDDGMRRMATRLERMADERWACLLSGRE